MVQHSGDVGDAGLSIYLRLSGPGRRMVMRRLELATVDRRWLPRVELSYILFAEDADDARESGLPLWEEFLEGARPAMAERFEVTFAPRRERRPASMAIR